MAAHIQGVRLSESSMLAIESLAELHAGSLQAAWREESTVVGVKSPIFAQVVLIQYCKDFK